MSYKVIDLENYYRKAVFKRFSDDCKCSLSITSKVDVTALKEFSERTMTKFYINFLYVLSSALNVREDYRMVWDWQNSRLLCYDRINPIQYIFHDDTETFTVAYTEYNDDYVKFYKSALKDAEAAKKTREVGLDTQNHPNWFDASFIPWLSYDALHLELPDGYLYFQPIINWGKYEQTGDKWMLPLTVRMNHAIADGYLVAKVFKLVAEKIEELVK